MNNQQTPGTGKRMALAIVLSLGLMIGLQYFTGSKKKQAAPAPKGNKTQNKKIENNTSTNKKTAATPAKAQDNKYESTNTEEKIIKKETNNYVLEFSSKGGVLKKVLLKKYFYEGGKFIDITPKVKNANAPLFLDISNLNLSIDYQVREGDKGSIIFFQEKDDIKVEKIFTVSQKDYHINLRVKVNNLTEKSFRSQLDLSWGTSVGPFVEKKFRTRYDEELITSYYDRREQEEEKITGETVQKSVDIDWIGLDNRYFFIAIIPENSGVYSFKLQNEDKIYDEKITLIESVNIEAKTAYSKSYTVYMGPKNEQLLKTYNRNLESISERGFSPIVLIGKGIKWLLFWLNSFINNFAWTIILFSLLLKFLLNPFTAKSMESAKKMQALQPQIAALKEKYKNKSQELNAKIWALYKQEKVSPAGSCLPMLLQMPFFFALYQVLPYIVELKNVHFLWIKDLSSPDTVMFIDIFKDIPVLPYRLNILPILMTIFSFIQTKVSHGGQSNTGQGKMMELMMPLVFLFVFWNMPSGLVLYWLLQTVFTIVHQYIKNKQPNKKQSNKKKSVKLSHKK